VVSHGRYVTFQVTEVAVSRIRDILMLIARLRGAARTSGKGAEVECDKERRQGCAMTKTKQQVLGATTRESIDSAARGTRRG
jgi:hypothetical protein